jgi:hypothetical protein
MIMSVAFGTSTPTSMTGRGDEHVHIAAAERRHDAVLLVLLEPPMEQRHRELREDLGTQVIRHRSGRAQVNLLGVLDEGVHHVDLPARLEFAPHETIDLIAPGLRLRDCRHGLSAGRQVPDHRHIQIAVGRERERTRNGRCGHDEHVGVAPLGP